MAKGGFLCTPGSATVAGTLDGHTKKCCDNVGGRKVSHKARLKSTRTLFPMFVTRKTNSENVVRSTEVDVGALVTDL